MQAAFIERYGEKEKLTLGDMPEPAPGPTDVLVAVRAASINPIDYKVRNGMLRPLRRYRFPLILGHDLAGVVIRVGSQVTRFQPGDEVFARPSRRGIGAFAELIAVAQEELAHKPKNLGFAEAASLPLVALTCWQALVDLGNVQPGQRVFIHAGSGGIGTFAIQLAKQLGAIVTATTSTRNLALVQSLGADKVIDYTKQDFREIADKQDVVLATLDGEPLYQSFDIVAPGGMVISLAGAPDVTSARELGLSWFMQAMFWMLSYRARSAARQRHATYRYLFMKANGAQLEKIAQLLEQGKIRPVVDKVYPFAEVQQALEYSEAGRARGKVVVALG